MSRKRKQPQSLIQQGHYFTNDIGLLYYERRSKQYDIVNTVVDNYKVISPSVQVTCFFGMFFDEPHETYGYYGKVLEKNSSRIFVENHSLYPYYISAYAFYSMERLRRIGCLKESIVKNYRYHMLMVFKYLVLSSSVFDSNVVSSPLDLSENKRSEAVFRKFQSVVHNDELLLELFLNSQRLIELAIDTKKVNYKSQLNRLPGFTEYILTDLLGRQPKPKPRQSLKDDTASGLEIGKEYTSTIATLNEGFGFIVFRSSETNNLFFHWTYLADGVEFSSLFLGMRVKFTAKSNDIRKGEFVAKNVRPA